MNWERFPGDLEELASLLDQQDETQRTANDLLTRMGHFKAMWRARRAIESGTAVQIPIPRDKALHPVASDVIESTLSFSFELGQNIATEYLPRRCDFQVCVKGAISYGPATFVELD